RRLVEKANGKDQLITQYDLFFQEPELELRRITKFFGFPGAKTSSAAALVAPRKSHTHFPIKQLIHDPGAPGVDDLYRALLAEASPSKANKGYVAKVSSSGDDLLPGSISRLNTFVPERIAQIEHLYAELLAQAEARHKEQVEELSMQLREKSISLAEA